MQTSLDGEQALIAELTRARMHRRELQIPLGENTGGSTALRFTNAEYLFPRTGEESESLLQMRPRQFPAALLNDTNKRTTPRDQYFRWSLADAEDPDHVDWVTFTNEVGQSSSGHHDAGSTGHTAATLAPCLKAPLTLTKERWSW